ncbi:hypothetical protein SADO_14839 [Salinisphaera dokdonensis CL-ES53]|uniref:DUF2946 domain-containing protein n=1 Tax=Salinisphaera dokdonensis CL-ES53 TaxID=1304272 RepID=A0ABV2B3W9_9GAMM
MDEWVERALARFPNVPALFGWLGLDRRGHWLIQGERISHARIVETIARNYGVDDHGRWFFQNGPQRGYIALEYTPLIASVQADDTLMAHTGRAIESVSALYLDEDSTAVLDTPDGAALVQGADLAWVLDRLRADDSDKEIDDQALSNALAVPSGTQTDLTLVVGNDRLPVYRCDRADIPATLGFVQAPEPRDGENSN